MMNSEALMAMALGLEAPWKIDLIEFKPGIDDNKELHIEIGFERGSKFPDSTGELCPVHDTRRHQWQHLSFFQHPCFLRCRVPRIKTSNGKVKTAEVPWARKGSGFTLLFEAYAMLLIEGEMTVSKVAKLVNVYAHRIWGIFNYWVGRAKHADQQSSITKLGVDETSFRKGHRYVTLAVDMDERRVIHATEGKGKGCIHAVSHYLQDKNVKPEQVEHISMDLSPAFISGAQEAFPNAEIHFDRFHVVKLLNQALDEVRREERKEHEALTGYRYAILKDPKKLSDQRKSEVDALLDLCPTLGQAYQLKEIFQKVWEVPNRQEAENLVQIWCNYVMNYSGIGPLAKFARTVWSHRTGIVNYVEGRINNGILEGINSKVQLAKRRARGYRNVDNFINMIYFLCGKLEFDYPHYST